jgi:NADH:ubiquinone reductase (non-electrogenic)
LQQKQTIPFGIIVWAGGIAPRPITKHICEKIGASYQSMPRRGIMVDTMLRVLGVSDGSVFALGDCAVSGLPPTAQVAYQQGKYVGRLFREGNYGSSSSSSQCLDNSSGKDIHDNKTQWFPFVYRDQGSMAYVGGSRAVAQLKPILWDKLDRTSIKRNTAASTVANSNSSSNSTGTSNTNGSVAPIPASANTLVQGESAFAVWRSLYFSKLMSSRNRYQVMCDWVCTSVYGRDISAPYVMNATEKPLTTDTDTDTDTAGNRDSKGKK